MSHPELVAARSTGSEGYPRIDRKGEAAPGHLATSLGMQDDPPQRPQPPSAIRDGIHPNQDLADAIARRVVELLRDETPLLDASEVARRLGRSREWVYDHRVELGVVPLGDGERPRLGFRPEKVAAYLDACEASRRTEGDANGNVEPIQPIRRRAQARQKAGKDDLLPIRGLKAA